MQINLKKFKKIIKKHSVYNIYLYYKLMFYFFFVNTHK